MRRQMVREVARSVTAAVALLGLVFGLPVALVLVRGWPLPSSTPSFDAIGDALDGASISDGVLLDARACLSWVVWALLTWCAGVETVAWVRGRAAHHVTGAGSVQMLVRRLVVGATLFLSASRSGSSMLSVPVTPPPLLLVSTDAPTSVVSDVVKPTPALPTCTVQPRDSLWRIADRHLGDPFRWREIFELNQGRSFDDGGVLRDADLIRPGWQLLLPADAVDATPPEPVVATTDLVPVTTSAPMPATTAEAPAAAPPVVVNPSHTADATSDDSADDSVDDSMEADYAVPPGLAATTLVLAGAVSTIAGLRRRQGRLREPGRGISLPDAAVLSVERTVRAAADLDGAERVDLALRALASQVEHPPPIDAVRVHADEIEVLFQEPAAGGDGPFSGVGTRAWCLPSSVPTESLIERAARGCVAPALVGIGRSDAGDVLIDLEAGGPLAVHGESADVSGVLLSLILDLATHRWADDVRVVAVGLPATGLHVLDRVELVDDLDAAVEDIVVESEANRTALERLGAESTWHARLADVGEGWTPTVLVLGTEVDPAAVGRALERLRDLPGVAVVSASPEEAPIDRLRRLIVASGRAQVALLPLDIVLQPAALPDDVLAGIDELVAVAARAEPGEVLIGEGPGDVIDLRDLVPDDLPSTRVIVRILGRVEIDGGRSPIDRRRVIEFVTLLALHRRGLTEGQIKAALWTDQEPSTNAFNQVVSRARVALGLDSTGQPHVRYVEDCVYRPGPELITDWSLLEAAWRSARAVADPPSFKRLEEALDTVRGLPFEGTKGYEWAYELALPSTVDAVVDEARSLIEHHGRSRVAG